MPTAPRQILIIRHGEKPGDPSTDSPADSPDLSTQRYERAASLAVYVPATFDKPDVLFATQASKNSNRPVETITPLANALGLTINDNYADDGDTALANEVLTNPEYAGKQVLICWHHGKIPELTSALGGVPPSGHWKGHVFDRVWQIDYPSGGTTTGLPVADIPQKLMYGDTST
jgi:broad specificity phosphatase PhoE